MSGQLKSYTKTFGKSEDTERKFEGDYWVKLHRWCKCENKKKLYKDFKGRYKLVGYTGEDIRELVDHKAVIVGDSFVIMSQDVLHGLLLGTKPKIEYVEDNKFKTIHGYFSQDNADIVSMVAKEGKFYLPFIFAITINLWGELLNESKGN